MFQAVFAFPTKSVLNLRSRTKPFSSRLRRLHFDAGAAGGIGQPLSLLLKMNERVDALSLYDVVGTPGVGADIGHIDSIAKVPRTLQR